MYGLHWSKIKNIKELMEKVNAILNKLEIEVLRTIREKFQNENIQLKDNLSEIGVNSIIFIELVVTFEAQFAFEFGDEDLDIGKYIFVNDLYSYIKDKLSSKDDAL